ncbi:MAG: HD domain-containing protein [Anaerolineae bacterium]|nr:HD domain-containing protein [Anaerolineae bacterium]
MALSQAQWNRVGQYVRSYLQRTAQNYGHKNAEYRAVWRWMHTLNVLKNLDAILDGEKAGDDARDVCRVAALFHDVDHYTVDTQYHALRGAETATAFLKREGHPAQYVERVAEAIRGHHHDFSDDEPIDEQVARIAAGLSHEARMVMDAETLDKIGANNILQSVLTMSAVSHPQIFEVTRELTSGWPLERARTWAQTLVTTTGKIMGAQRLDFYERLLRQLAEEVVADDPFPQPSQLTQESLQVPE